MPYISNEKGQSEKQKSFVHALEYYVVTVAARHQNARYNRLLTAHKEKRQLALKKLIIYIS